MLLDWQSPDSWCCLLWILGVFTIFRANEAIPMDGRSTLERLLDEIRQRDERPSDLLRPYPRRPKSMASSPTKGTIPLHVGIGRTPPWLLLNDYVDSESESDEQTARSDRNKCTNFDGPVIAIEGKLKTSSYFVGQDTAASYKRAADRRVSPVSPLPQAVVTGAKLDCSGVLECASREVITPVLNCFLAT